MARKKEDNTDLNIDFLSDGENVYVSSDNSLFEESGAPVAEKVKEEDQDAVFAPDVPREQEESNFGEVKVVSFDDPASTASDPSQTPEAVSPANVQKATYKVGGVGSYPVSYRIRHFLIVLLLAALTGGGVYLLCFSLDFAYLGTFILYAVIAGEGACVLFYLVMSFVFMRHSGDILSEEEYGIIYRNGERVKGKSAAIYKRLNGAYYALAYSFVAVAIVTAAEIAFAVALNFLGGA